MHSAGDDPDVLIADDSEPPGTHRDESDPVVVGLRTLALGRGAERVGLIVERSEADGASRADSWPSRSMRHMLRFSHWAASRSE